MRNKRQRWLPGSPRLPITTTKGSKNLGIACDCSYFAQTVHLDRLLSIHQTKPVSSEFPAYPPNLPIHPHPEPISTVEKELRRVAGACPWWT